MPSAGSPAWRRRAAQALRSSRFLDAAYARLTYLRAALGRATPLQRGEAVSPIFIVGPGRSGNTLLRRMLQATGEVHIPPETYVLGETISIFQRGQNLPWPHLVRLVLAQFEFHPDFGDFEVSLRPLANRLVETPRRLRSLASILDALYSYHAEQAGASAPRWGDKTPLNVYSLDRIHRVFPRAQYVHLIRDGVDVVHSYVDSGLMQSVEEAAARWTTSMAASDRFIRRHPRACLQVRYEDLVTAPASTLARVCAFLDIEFDPAFVDERDHVAGMGDVGRYDYHAAVREPVHPTAIGKGRRALRREQIDAIAGGLAPVLARLGYAPPHEGGGASGTE